MGLISVCKTAALYVKIQKEGFWCPGFLRGRGDKATSLLSRSSFWPSASAGQLPRGMGGETPAPAVASPASQGRGAQEILTVGGGRLGGAELGKRREKSRPITICKPLLFVFTTRNKVRLLCLSFSADQYLRGRNGDSARWLTFCPLLPSR